MKFTILTLFPELVEPFFTSSIMAKAVDRGLVEYEIINIRDFTTDKHKTCDDAPYGGGAGMVLMPQPLGAALDSVGGLEKTVVYPSPSGKPLDQATAYSLAQEKELVFVCGRYEGIDQRVIDRYVNQEVSIGDYVISSGEISTLVVVDAVYRLLDGVISGESLVEESFSDNLLEYPHYTRPEEYWDMRVPDVLLSGHHKKIEEWRMEQRIKRTKERRPDLHAKGNGSEN